MKENATLKERNQSYEAKIDDLEQYSRRNSLRVSGINESKNENTDDLIIKLSDAVGAEITLSEIGRSHRVGKPNPGRPDKPRDILVKFVSYRSRQKLYKLRSTFKDNGYGSSYVNEDLTRRRSYILFKARDLVRSRHLLGAWSSDGNLLARDNKSRIHRISHEDDLDVFLLEEPRPETPTLADPSATMQTSPPTQPSAVD